jgi:hypothetical protein
MDEAFEMLILSIRRLGIKELFHNRRRPWLFQKYRDWIRNESRMTLAKGGDLYALSAC